MRYSLGQCKDVQEEHRKSKRQYAHVFHIPGQVCLADEFEQLPEKNRLGILMHELGHIIAGPSKGELAANRAAENAFGILIKYGRSKHGQDLEYIDAEHFARAREILQENFS